MVTMKLDWHEIEIAALTGIRRRIENLSKNIKGKNGFDIMNVWDVDIDSCCAEMVVAKWKGWYWNGNINNYKAADVSNLQVRSTKYKTGKLILHNWDKDDDVFILVITNCPVYKIVGWIFGYEGKQSKYWTDPTGRNRHAYFIPQRCLRELDEMRLKEKQW